MTHHQHKNRLLAALTAGCSLALGYAALADERYLPPPRYQSSTEAGLPSPNLLFPERRLPLHSNAPSPETAPATVTAPLPIIISPSAPNEPTVSTPQPHYVPDVPLLETKLPDETPLAAPPPRPAILPPPPPPILSPASMPNFQPLSTIETHRAAAAAPPPPVSAPLQRQPIAADIPPAPDINVPLAAPMPAITPPPMGTKIASAKPAPKEPALDTETEAILARIPSGIDTPKGSGHKTDLQRFDPEIKGVLDNASDKDNEAVARHESMGVAIEVRQPNLDLTVELQNAYEALMGGQPQIALQIYQDILQQVPNHQDALFGMATTYHRTGELERAQPFYVKLLTLNPNHRDGLINFLSLVAEEAPQEASERLEYLAGKNPDFSAIPALLGIIYEQMGKREKAIDSMIRAVRMEPENLAYKYNLAVMYDENNMPSDAIVLYNQLLSAGRSGLPLPAPMRDLQERVITLQSQNNES